MSNPTIRYERRKQKLSIINIFFIFLFLRCIEYYVFMPYSNFNSHGVITCGLGVTVMFFYLRTICGSLKSVGLVANPVKLPKWIGLGVLFSVCSTLVITTIELICYKILGTQFTFQIYSYDYKFSEKGSGIWLTAIVVCIIVSIVKDTLFESLYRGLILIKLRKLCSFNKANIVQSVLYSLWFIVIPLRYLIWNTPNYSYGYIIKLCLYYIVLEFMSAFKWGLQTRASGAVWVPLIDHIVFDILIESIHFVKLAGGDENWLLRALMIQFISFGLTIVYYFYRKKKRPGLFKDNDHKRQMPTNEDIKNLSERPQMLDYKDILSDKSYRQ